jgi:hypothetical protein
LDGTVGAFPIGIAEAERAMTSPGWNALRVPFTKLNEILKTESRARAERARRRVDQSALKFVVKN